MLFCDMCRVMLDVQKHLTRQKPNPFFKIFRNKWRLISKVAQIHDLICIEQ